MSTPFLQEVLQNMKNIMGDRENTCQFYIYSAHDTTVALILNALNLTSTECTIQAFLG